jgi:ABC-2 type transport system permease protein
MAGLLEAVRPARRYGDGGPGLPRLCGRLIRLKLTILGHSSPGMRLARLICWPAAVAVSWLAVVFADGPAARHDVLLVGLALWTAGWVTGPVLASGAGVLRPDWFALLPLDRRRLGLALLAAALVGVGPAVTLLALGALLPHATGLGAGAVAVTVAALPLLLVFLVALSRLVYAAMGAAMGSRLGVAISAVQYGALLAGMTVGWVALDAVGGGIAGLLRDGLPGTAAARGLELLPTAWPVLAAEAAGEGRTAAALGLLLALAVAAAALVAVCLTLLAPRPRTVRPAARVRRRARLGLLPATPLGAVAAKELRQWWRDPWRSLEIQCACWFGVLVAVLGWISGVSELVPFAGAAVAFSVALSACNLLGQDGTAFWLTVAGQGPGSLRADIRGRQLALLLLFTPPAVVLGVAGTALSGVDWAWPLLGLLPALLGIGAGLAVLLSVVAVTAGVDPKYRVGPNDAGDVTFQVWVALLSVGVLASPAIVVAAAGARSGGAGAVWTSVAVGLLNGAVVAWLLGRIAAARLHARLPETFARLRYGKAIALEQQPAGTGGLLDWMERTAVDTNQERRPVGS